jgi:hypothetical protein
MLCSPASPYHKDDLTTVDDSVSQPQTRGHRPVRYSSRSSLTLAPVVRLVIEISVGSPVSAEGLAWRDRARTFVIVSIARECAR